MLVPASDTSRGGNKGWLSKGCGKAGDGCSRLVVIDEDDTPEEEPTTTTTTPNLVATYNL